MLIEARPALDPEVCALLGAPDEAAAHLVAVVGGRAVACGAWRAGPPGVAELRCLYVRPAFRGRGIARQLIVALEEEALAAGRAVVRVAAAAGSAANALLVSSGYAPGAAGFEKRLVALAG